MAMFVGVIGMVAILAGVLLGRRVLQVRSWPTVEATVTDRGVGLPEGPTGGSRSARFVPKVTLAYEVAGRPFVSTGRSPVQQTMTQGAARAWVDALAARPRIYYNPKDPGEAYLQPGSLVPAGAAVAVGLISVAVALLL